MRSRKLDIAFIAFIRRRTPLPSCRTRSHPLMRSPPIIPSPNRGKEPSYFTSAWPVLREIAKTVPLVMTAKEIPENVIPEGITNLGIVSQR